MSMFAPFAAAGEPEEDDYDPSNIRCHICGGTFSGTDRSGGHCRAPLPDGSLCCQSFASQHAADKHRVGPYDPPGQRWCLTPDEMRSEGWQQDERGAWRTAPPTNNPWKKES
jgi:hypothetical protein